MVTIPRESAQELNNLLEDLLEYWCQQQAEYGTLVSGETGWKLVSAYAQAHEAQFLESV